MSLKIEIPGRPVAWQRVGVCGRRFFDRQAKERLAYQLQLKQACRNGPTTAPIALMCVFSFQMPKSWSKAKRTAMLGKPHESRPDLDNLVKFVSDAANGILWADDCQLSRFASVEKVWGNEDKTIINFEVLNG